MFRHVVPTLYHKVFFELLAEGRKLCVKTYKEAQPLPPPPEGAPPPPPRTFVPIGGFEFLGPLEIGKMPPPVKDKEFVPPNVGFFQSADIPGEELSPLLGGRNFHLVSFALLDLDDPSIVLSKEPVAAVWYVGVSLDGAVHQIYNAIARDAGQDMHPFRSMRQNGVATAGLVYQPFPDIPLEKCSVTLKTNPELGFLSNIDGWTSVNNDHLLSDFHRSIPKIELVRGGGRIVRDGWADVVVKVTHADGQPARTAVLKLEETGGYLPMRSIEVRDGEAAFRVGSLGLNEGQRFRVNIGLANLPGLLSIPFEVGV